MYQECVDFPSNHTKKELRIVWNKFVSLILLFGDEKDLGHLQFQMQWSATCTESKRKPKNEKNPLTSLSYYFPSSVLTYLKVAALVGPLEIRGAWKYFASVNRIERNERDKYTWGEQSEVLARILGIGGH